MRDFKSFAELVKKNIEEMSKDSLFMVEDKDDRLYNLYLSSFPDGENPILLERTEHDCSCCKHFIRSMANVVSIKDGVMKSIWDIDGAQYPYDVVSQALNECVLSSKVVSSFFTPQERHGQKSSKRMIDDKVVTNNHFYAEVNSRHVCPDVESKKGSVNTSAQVLLRGLEEISMDAIDDVIGLIEDNSIYRGAEHLNAVKKFKRVLSKYNKPTNADKSLLAWEFAADYTVSRFRNSVIGTLVVDISNGVDLEKAVKSFESKVAPSNYKRSKSLITKKMIEDAAKTIDELGVRDSLERRFAVVSDVSANDVLFVDRSVNPLMKDPLVELLSKDIKTKPIKDENAKNISIDDFMANVVPKTECMEVYVKNSQKSNFFSLTAPKDESSKHIFKWKNNFSWGYDGDVADSSIKERVKSAGGNVSAPFRVSLAWFNYDDLDIHAVEPSGREIFFSNKRSPTGGFLDVDMNAGGSSSREAVENICWKKAPDGDYKIYVNQYARRENIDVGFELEVENNGNLYHYSYSKMVSGKKLALTISLKAGLITDIKLAKDIVGNSISQEKWGINTESFAKVNMLMNSPNYWDGEETGNKHYMFVLDGCKNPDSVRGFYNEFLRDEFHKHRKTFEILGARMKCEPSDEQLSGLGFSSTKKDSVIIKVQGEQNRIYNVNF